MSADLAALRAYVVADTGAQARAESTVLLTVTHSNLRAVFMELRFDLHVRARLRRAWQAVRMHAAPLTAGCALARARTLRRR